MNIEIVPIRSSDIESFRNALNEVAKERKFLASFEAPSIGEVRKFVELNIELNRPQFVALHMSKVVGWCDIIQKREPIRHHCGILGMGLLRKYRSQGYGQLLLQTTLNAAKECGLTRIELNVRASNKAAIKFYEKAGFLIEGVLKDDTIIDGRYVNTHVMAFLQN